MLFLFTIALINKEILTLNEKKILSIHCTEVKNNVVEENICKNSELITLDRKIDKIYKESLIKEKKNTKILEIEQRGWLLGRNDCWKNENLYKCISDSYTYRIAELQVEYNLVPNDLAIVYLCDAEKKNELILTFFHTNPVTLFIEYNNEKSLMYLYDEKNKEYQGRNTILKFLSNDAINVVWGFDAPSVVCKKKIINNKQKYKLSHKYSNMKFIN